MTILVFPPKRILGRFVPTQLPPAGSFEGRAVLVTGGTAGLGLAAAVHFARLGAHVLVTCRDRVRGDNARERIESEAEAEGSVSLFELDMSSYASCVGLVGKLKEWCQSNNFQAGLDVAVLNAGRIDPQFALSPEGWEQTVQVNSLSTALLGLLLVAWMRDERRGGRRSTPAHLVFVTSRDHLYPDITRWPDCAAENERGLLGHFSDPQNWPSVWADTQPNYGNSKTLVMHAIQEISKLATRGEGGDIVDVIVNSVCPGLVHTEIGRAIAGQSWYMRMLTRAYLSVGGKSPEMGARFYVLAAMRDERDHGKFIMAWLTDEQYSRRAVANMTGAHARKVHALIWREMRADFLAKVPELAAILPEILENE